MVEVTEIMDMIDWNMPLEIQNEGVFLAKKTGTIRPFIQPLTPRYNKNVWGNCAKIIAEANDEKIKPHLILLLEWLQDMNWPGANCVFNRLEKYSDNIYLETTLKQCIKKAEELSDGTWIYNLELLMQKISQRTE